MRPGMVDSSAGESSYLVGILGGLLYRLEDIMLIVMYSVTGWVDRAAPPTPFPRTQGISVREMID
jgi:hypothetical protein